MGQMQTDLAEFIGGRCDGCGIADGLATPCDMDFKQALFVQMAAMRSLDEVQRQHREDAVAFDQRAVLPYLGIVVSVGRLQITTDNHILRG